MIPKFEEEYVRMNVPNIKGILTKDEVEAAQIYCVLVLKRIAGNEEEEEGVNDPLGKLPQEISEADIVNLLQSRLCLTNKSLYYNGFSTIRIHNMTILLDGTLNPLKNLGFNC